MIIECPECGSDLQPDGLCSDIDCPFVACAVCLADDPQANDRGVMGFPPPAGRAACGHLVMCEQGEVDPRFVLDITPGVPNVITDPPDEGWFDHERVLDGIASALDLDTTAAPDLDGEHWSDSLIEWIGVPLAERHGAHVVANQFGWTHYWLRDPAGFWREVAEAVQLVIAAPIAE